MSEQRNDEPPPRLVKPEYLPPPLTEDEIARHLQALRDIEPNLERGQLVFPPWWIRSWIEFDRRLIHERGHGARR